VVGHVVAETMGRVPGHVSRDDLAGAGAVALVAAARGYRPETGVPFDRYARIRVRGAVVDELRRGDWATRGVRRRGRRLAEAEERLRAELGRAPTTEELAVTLGVAPDAVERVRRDSSRAVVVPLEPAGAPTAHEGALDDILAAADDSPEDRVAHAERVGALMAAVAALPERLRVVVEGYDLHERPMAGIAADLGVTESRVSQLRSQALGLLRAALDERTGGAGGHGALARRRRDAYVAAARGRSDLRARLDAGARALTAGADRVTSPAAGPVPSGGTSPRR
jgi:RNA polymerase sigma factor for flagellar operon FliA